MVNQKNHGRRI